MAVSATSDVDVAEQVADQVDAVRGQVAEHPAAAAVALEPPGQRAVRVGGVVAEEPEPGVRDGAELAGGDQLPGGVDGRGVAVVEADRALHAGLADRVGDRAGVGGGQADRLLDPDVLAGPGQRDAHLAVQEVGRGDADGLRSAGRRPGPASRGWRRRSRTARRPRSARPGTSSATATSSGRTARAAGSGAAPGRRPGCAPGPSSRSRPPPRRESPCPRVNHHGDGAGGATTGGRSSQVMVFGSSHGRRASRRRCRRGRSARTPSRPA